MSTDDSRGAATPKPKRSYRRVVLWTVGVLFFLVFIVPTAVGFYNFYVQDRQFKKTFYGTPEVPAPARAMR